MVMYYMSYPHRFELDNPNQRTILQGLPCQSEVHMCLRVHHTAGYVFKPTTDYANYGCMSLLVATLLKLPSQCYSNKTSNLGNLGGNKEIQLKVPCL